MNEKIAILGLGYVGLPLALAVARKFPGTIGFDINESKLASLRQGIDITREIGDEELKASSLVFSSKVGDLSDVTFFIVAVPTPVDAQKRPDLRPLIGASQTVGRAIRPGAVVVYESTVYPGVTQDVCGPIIEQVSGLRRSVDFKLGYSPERINPGDKEHTLERIVKVVSAEDGPTLDRVASVYSTIVSAGVFRAASIKVAEAAKVIENTQRDLNIALMNELALIFERLGIRTRDVLAAAQTKWNFLPFRPGLVGGHCIGVDPYYLTSKAEELGYQPQVILAGRRINDGMGPYIAQRVIKLMAQSGHSVASARIGVLGLTFKENVPDIRNSRVPDIIRELREFGIEALVHDPLARPQDAHEEYGITLAPLEAFTDLDAIILAVNHKAYLGEASPGWLSGLKKGGVLVDVKSALDPDKLPGHVAYWSL